MDPDDEAVLEADGKAYRLYYGNRAFRVAEVQLGKNWLKADLAYRQDVTVLIWAGLQQHHPDTSMEDVDDLIDAVGFGRVVEVATVAMNKALGGKGTAGGNGRGPGKRTARARTVTGGAGS